MFAVAGAANTVVVSGKGYSSPDGTVHARQSAWRGEGHQQLPALLTHNRKVSAHTRAPLTARNETSLSLLSGYVIHKL